jgi:hypothetical protein
MKLLDQVRQTLRVGRYSYRTEQCYLGSMEQFIRFHMRVHKRGAMRRHPAEIGAAEVEQSLTHLAVRRHLSASTRNQALKALLSPSQSVLEQEIRNLTAVRARRPERTLSTSWPLPRGDPPTPPSQRTLEPTGLHALGYSLRACPERSACAHSSEEERHASGVASAPRAP